MRKIFTKTKLADKNTGMLGSETAQSAKTVHMFRAQVRCHNRDQTLPTLLIAKLSLFLTQPWPSALAGLSRGAGSIYNIY